MVWPHNEETWPGRFPEAQSEFEALVKTIAEFEPVRLFVLPSHYDELQTRFRDCVSVEVQSLATNDSWIRDFGPTFVHDPLRQTQVGICWRYNGWGEKYPPFDLDQQAASTALNQLQIDAMDSPLVIEGGALETNGKGTLLTTSNTIYHPNRNPQWSQNDIKKELCERLGISQLVVFKVDPIPGDDTDGHIDQVARFINSDTILVTEDQEDVVRQIQQETEFQSVLLPAPEPVFVNGQRVPASYANFYFCNQAVIVPQFQTATDQRALRIFEELIPQRQVIGLSSRTLSLGLGSFHCLTQQQPHAGPSAESA